MIKNFITLFLSLHIIANATPAIVPFNYQTDIAAVETILKDVWSALFWMPHYDHQLIKVIFEDKHPGDPIARNHPLSISVLKDNGQLIGFITYYQPNSDTGHIELLAIDKAYKGLGCGKKLINYVQNWFARLGCKYLQLYVYTANTHAIQFYNHLGFNIKKKFPGYLLFTKQIA